MNLNWILAGLLACGFVMGWRKGLFRIISGLAGMIISIYVAFLFNPSLAAIIDESIGFTHRVALFISKYLSVSELAASFPGRLLSQSSLQSADKILAAPGQTIAQFLLYILSFIILLILTKLCLSLVSGILTKCLDRTLIGPLNRLLGGLVGTFFVALIIGVSLLGLSGIFGNRPGSGGSSLINTINQSDLAGFLLSLF